MDGEGICDVCGGEAIGTMYRRKLCGSEECRAEASEGYVPGRTPRDCLGG
jgi:hypothetical protein